VTDLSPPVLGKTFSTGLSRGGGYGKGLGVRVYILACRVYASIRMRAQLVYVQRKLRAQIDVPSIVIYAIVVLMVTLIGFMVIGQLQQNMQLTGTWNTTYTNFVKNIQQIFPLIATLLIVIVAVSIIAVILNLFRGGGA
jgi:type II secretory pathway component PulF